MDPAVACLVTQPKLESWRRALWRGCIRPAPALNWRLLDARQHDLATGARCLENCGVAMSKTTVLLHRTYQGSPYTNWNIQQRL